MQTAPFLCQGDLQRIHTGLGKIWYERSRQARLNKLDRYVELEQSYTYYEKAIALNPYDILAVQGIAETVAGLEFTFAELFPGKENKYNAQPFFKRVSEVEPNGLASNYSTARYFYKKGLQGELFSQVQHCAKIFPVYGKLKKEPFYSPETKEAVRLGLEQAVQANIMVQRAYFSLASYWKEQQRFSKAAGYYKKALALTSGITGAKKHLTYGRLLLKAGNKEQAYREFIEVLRDNKTVRKSLRTIYSAFKKQNDLAGFIEFAMLAEAKQIKADELQFSIARAQSTLKLFEAAKDTLRTINAKNPTAFAYCMLAELARKEKNWDSMELSIQRATVLDPDNGKYFNILADALIYQNKYKPAAYYMQKALANDPENPKYREKFNKIRSHYD